MAKQKSGLGRGLNALFDDGSNAAAKKPAAPANKESNQEPTPAQAYVANASVEAVEASKPVEKQEKKASDIYISEDALENAKVVEREARPVQTVRVNSAQKKSTQYLNRKPAPAPVRNQPSSRSVSNARPVEKVSPIAPAAAVKTEAPAAKAPVVKDEKGATGIVDLAKIKPNPDQPRTNFKPEEIEELANSIKKEGLLQPVLVRKMGDFYQIIAGERRWQACKSLGMKQIPVRFWDADNDKALELALIENIQRSDLNPIEEAYGYKRLMERKGMTQSEVAQTVSKGRSTIANALRLLDLPEEAQQLLFENKITAGHARAILSIPTPEGRKTLTKKLIEEKLSVRETEAIARLLSGRDKAKEEGGNKRVPAPASFKKAARGLTKFLSVPVRVKTVQGKNKIEIQFKDEEELERIFKKISEVKTEEK